MNDKGLGEAVAESTLKVFDQEEQTTLQTFSVITGMICGPIRLED